MRICPYCSQPIVLEPSATERAKKHGGKPSYYTDLFPYHAECFVADRSRQSSELMASISAKHSRWEPRDSSEVFCKNCNENFYKHTAKTLLCPNK